MEEHPLFEQGDACPAIRLPLQQFEAMEKAFRWPVAPRQSEPCLYGRLLFVEMAGKCLQVRLAMLLHFLQPPPDTSSYECRRIWAVVMTERWWYSCEQYGSTSHDRAPLHASAGVAVRRPPLAPAGGSVARAPAPFGQPARPIPRWPPPAPAGSLAAGDDALFGWRARSPQAAS